MFKVSTESPRSRRGTPDIEQMKYFTGRGKGVVATSSGSRSKLTSRIPLLTGFAEANPLAQPQRDKTRPNREHKFRFGLDNVHNASDDSNSHRNSTGLCPVGAPFASPGTILAAGTLAVVRWIPYWLLSSRVLKRVLRKESFSCVMVSPL